MNRPVKITIKKVQANPGYGNRVFVQGVIRKSIKDRNYCEVEILDCVYGMPICKVTCHIAGLYEQLARKNP